MNFKGKTVLVTGSSRSLGKQIVYDFVSCGANVVINYNNSFDEAVLFEKELKDKFNSKTLVVKCDVSNEEEVVSMVDKCISVFGKIDILVNNASICRDSLFDDKSYSDFSDVLGVNLIGTYLVTKHVGKFMLENSYGKIINIASDNGIDAGYPESCDYDSSKAGVISLTHNMAKYYAPYVNVNCVCPGWIDTDMNKDLSDNQRKDICDKILVKRFASVKEISNVVLFLTSDYASYVNDSIIKVNGGSL
ncbi:MAG: SDR family oxidoreductase [Bacilli bacterium]